MTPTDTPLTPEGGGKKKHTPGPWEVYQDIRPSVKHRYPGIEGPDGVTIVVWGDTGDETGVRANFNAHPATIEANAKLIAAAPEMLQVLQEADAWLSFNQRPDADQIRVFRKSMQEVIKKATR